MKFEDNIFETSGEPMTIDMQIESLIHLFCEISRHCKKLKFILFLNVGATLICSVGAFYLIVMVPDILFAIVNAICALVNFRIMLNTDNELRRMNAVRITISDDIYDLKKNQRRAKGLSNKHEHT